MLGGSVEHHSLNLILTSCRILEVESENVMGGSGTAMHFLGYKTCRFQIVS